MWSSEFFKPPELLSPDGLALFNRGLVYVQHELIECLDDLRLAVGRPVFCNHAGLNFRGYRSPEENARIEGSAKYSRHVQGIAADIEVHGMTPAELAEIAESVGFTGIGIYDSFVHVDVRAGEAVVWHK